MKKLCSIQFVIVFVVLTVLAGVAIAKNDPVKAVVPGNTVVQDLAADFMLINCDVSLPNRICSLPPSAPQFSPAWADIKSAKISASGEEWVDLSIALHEPIPLIPPVPFISYYWQFQEGCVEPSPTDKSSIVVWWDGNTNTWSAHWFVITSCNPRRIIMGDSVPFQFTDDGIKVRVPLDDLITTEGESLKWFTGVHRLPFVHGVFTHTWPTDVAPCVIDLDYTTTPPSVVYPEESATWNQH